MEIHGNGNGPSLVDRIMGNFSSFLVLSCIVPGCTLESPIDLQKIQISRLHSPEIMN